jgi:hypothetical protein
MKLLYDPRGCPAYFEDDAVEAALEKGYTEVSPLREETESEHMLRALYRRVPKYKEKIAAAKEAGLPETQAKWERRLMDVHSKIAEYRAEGKE